MRRIVGLPCSIAAALCAVIWGGAIAAAPDPATTGTLHDAQRPTSLEHSSWAADPTLPGTDLPLVGRSLFDHLTADATEGASAHHVPFPFAALIERIQARLSQEEINGGARLVMIPMGRSLQRVAASPDFFKFPRIVFAVTGEPAAGGRDAGMLLKDRLYLGYVEKTGLIEVISYNEAAGRFEFQLVKDYRAGGEPKVFYANRAICVSCAVSSRNVVAVAFIVLPP